MAAQYEITSGGVPFQEVIQSTNRELGFIFMFYKQFLIQGVLFMMHGEFSGAALPLTDAVHKQGCK